MSYFLFGSFNSSYNVKMLHQVQEYALKNDIYVWFDDEINIYEDIDRMLTEQKSNGLIKFAITSKNQPKNSSDVIFPFDKYSGETLFADKSRTFYLKCCKVNLDILFDCMNYMVNSLEAHQTEILITEGYDDIFSRKSCSMAEAENDLLRQIEIHDYINSIIYRVSD